MTIRIHGSQIKKFLKEILDEIFGGVGHGPKNNRLEFSGDLDPKSAFKTIDTMLSCRQSAYVHDTRRQLFAYYMRMGQTVSLLRWLWCVMPSYRAGLKWLYLFSKSFPP